MRTRRVHRNDSDLLLGQGRIQHKLRRGWNRRTHLCEARRFNRCSRVRRLGNILGYYDADSSTVAQYTYGGFGTLIAKSGPLADFFRHRFSTKYFDAETGLYYYGYRFYCPAIMRWLTRDPMGEEGGLNLYEFCANNSNCHVDFNGLWSHPL